MGSFSHEKPQLPVHEWMAIAVLILFLLGLTLLAFFSQQRAFPIPEAPPKELVEQEIEVFVEGAVEHPGHFHVKKGALVKDVLEQAKPTSDANLKRIKPDRKLRKGQVIKIPRKRVAKKKSSK